MASPLAGRTLPLPMRAGGIALLGLVLVLFFVFLGFPRQELAGYLAVRLTRATGLGVGIESARPSLHLAGPGITASGVRATTADGRELALDELVLRPAWSLAWLRGRPALAIRARGPSGRAAGTATLGAARRFDGELAELDLAALPLAELWPGLSVDGSAQATVALELAESRPQGTLSLAAREGSLRVGDLAMAVPYDRLDAQLTFGDGKLASIEKLALAGPMLSADVEGYLGEAPSLERAPVRLQIQLRAEPAVREALIASGVRLGADGSGRLLVSGTPARPILR